MPVIAAGWKTLKANAFEFACGDSLHAATRLATAREVAAAHRDFLRDMIKAPRDRLGSIGDGPSHSKDKVNKLYPDSSILRRGGANIRALDLTFAS